MKSTSWIAIGIFSACLTAGPVLGEEGRRSATWDSYCSVCHGSDGRANTEEGKKKGARNLTEPRWQASVSDARLESSIRRGREKMPAFGKKLTDGDIKALVIEVRTFVPR